MTGHTGLLLSDVVLGYGENIGIAWLESSGKVFSMRETDDIPEVRTVLPRFSNTTVLALASQVDTTLMCAVLSDGSVACTSASDYVGRSDPTSLMAAKAAAGTAISSCSPL